MIRFDSDYLEGCLPEILLKMQETNLEQTVGYGMDEHCAHARDLVRRACGGSPELDIHFLVGGTQTNATVISSVLRPYQGALCADSGHINVHETGAIEHSGHKVLALPSTNGKISAEQIDEAIEAHYADPSSVHTVQPGMVYISFPTEVGTLYSKSELTAISDVCHRRGIPLFIDGARLGYGLCSPACDVTLEDIARACDIFYIGGTKQGALFGEAVVFKNSNLSRDFRYCIKQNGGLLAKGRLLGIQFETLFADAEPLYYKAAKNAIDKALKLRQAFALRGYTFLVDSYTNQQFPILPDSLIARLEKDFGFEPWQKMETSPTGEPMTAVRFVTSWATTDAAIDALVAAL